MNGAQIVEALESTRIRLLEAIEPLSDEELLEPGVLDSLSVRDILVLITVWEAELITGLMRLQQDRKPARLLTALKNREAYNQQVLAENEGRDLERIFEDLQGVYVQLERWLEQFSDRDLASLTRYPSLQGRPLWQIIQSAAFGLEAEFTPVLEAFASRKNSSRGGATIISGR